VFTITVKWANFASFSDSISWPGISLLFISHLSLLWPFFNKSNADYQLS